MSVVGGISIQNGDPYRLIAPSDSTGSICGISPSVTNQAKFYTVTSIGQGACVATCPTVASSNTSTNANDYICLPWVYSAVANPSYPAIANISSYVQAACMVKNSNGVKVFNPFTATTPSLSACGCMLKLPTG